MRQRDKFTPKCENDRFTVTRTELRRHFYALLRFIENRENEGISTVIHIIGKGKRDLMLTSID